MRPCGINTTAYHLGKVEPLAGRRLHHTGVALAKLGYVVICPDALCFGERRNKDLAGGNFERFEFLRYVVAGKCMAWKNILDMRRAVDYLCTRPEVNKDRIGCYGHSMGSTHTWLVGPWEPRLKCLVGNCCLPTYAAIGIARTSCTASPISFPAGSSTAIARHRRTDAPRRCTSTWASWTAAAPSKRPAKESRPSPAYEKPAPPTSSATSLKRRPVTC